MFEWKRNSPSRQEKRAGRVGAPRFNEIIQLDGLMMVVDPVLSRIARTMARTSPQPLATAALPTPDVLLLTHGHFDLTDEPSGAGPKLLFQHVRERGLAASRFHVLRPGGVMGFAEDEVTTRSSLSFEAHSGFNSGVLP